MHPTIGHLLLADTMDSLTTFALWLRPIIEALLPGLMLGWTIGIAFLWEITRMNRGKLVSKCRVKRHASVGVAAALMIVFAMMNDDDPQLRGLFFFAGLNCLVMYLLGKPGIYEHGLAGLHLIPWGRFQDYEWKDSTLVLRWKLPPLSFGWKKHEEFTIDGIEHPDKVRELVSHTIATKQATPEPGTSTCPQCAAPINTVTKAGLASCEGEPWLMICEKCQAEIEPDD